MTTHNGHRQRLKQRVAEEGLDGFSDIQALELLLFYCIPRRDTNPIAHDLLDRFGSFAQVLEAPPEELQKVPGVGASAAGFLHTVLEAGRYYQVSRVKDIRVLRTLDECGEFLVPYFHGRTVETVFLLCMDAKCKVLCCKQVGEGGINSTGVSLRKLVETALGARASQVVLSHNHPSGLAIPSEEDIATTRRAAAALKAVEIQLTDHVIVAEDDYVSLRQSGLQF